MLSGIFVQKITRNVGLTAFFRRASLLPISKDRETLATDRLTSLIPDQGARDEEIVPIWARSRYQAADDEVSVFLRCRKTYHLAEFLSSDRNSIEVANLRRGLRATSDNPRCRNVDSARRHHNVDAVGG